MVSLEGIRAQESGARAEKTPFTVRSSITGKRYRELSLEEAWVCYQEDSRSDHVVQLPLFADAPDASVAPRPMTHALPRLAFTWYPLFDWSIDDVWHACGTSQTELEELRDLYQEGVRTQNVTLRTQALAGWPAHPAYVLGAHRQSCSLCFLGNLATLEAGARYNPDYYRSLCWLEVQSGYSFQPTRWLCDVAPDLLTEEMRMLLEHHPRRQHWLAMSAERARRQNVRKLRRALPMATR